MLSDLPTMAGMRPWQVIEEALARLKPPRKQEWLATELSRVSGRKITPQAISNWKERGVPPGRFRALATVLNLTMNQIEGLDPLPWEKQVGWPFESIDQARFDRLGERQKGDIEGRVREMIEKFEAEARAPRLGESSSSPGGSKGKRSA